VYTP